MDTTQTPQSNGTTNVAGVGLLDSLPPGRPVAQPEITPPNDTMIGLDLAPAPVAGVQRDAVEREATWPNLSEEMHALTRQLRLLITTHNAIHAVDDRHGERFIDRHTSRPSADDGQVKPTKIAGCTTGSELQERLDDLTAMENELEAPSSTLTDANLTIMSYRLRCGQNYAMITAARLRSSFTSLVYSTTSSEALVRDMLSKIGHPEFHHEAEMHLAVISRLTAKLNDDDLTKPSFNIAGPEASRVLGLMLKVEDNRVKVECLVQEDHTRISRITWAVLGFVFAVITTTIAGAGYLFPNVDPTSDVLPLVKVPVGVVVWSLMGGLVAMLRRFNTRPIYDFGDAAKWMLTRPLQGAMLGLVMYLALKSGLFVFGGNDPATVSDAVIGVISFLVGFHDGFAEGVFDGLAGLSSPGGKPGEARIATATQRGASGSHH